MSRTHRWLAVVAASAAVLAAVPALAGARSLSGSHFDATQLLGRDGMTIKVGGPMGPVTNPSMRITFTVVDGRGHVVKGIGWMSSGSRWNGTARVPAGKAPLVPGARARVRPRGDDSRGRERLDLRVEQRGDARPKVGASRAEPQGARHPEVLFGVQTRHGRRAKLLQSARIGLSTCQAR